MAALFLLALPAFGQGLIVDHTKTNLTPIPESAILQAKQNLRIAYGHTSHGSQVTEGMGGLIAFMNAKKTDAFADNLFTFNNGGTGGALDYRDFYGNFGGLGIADDLGAPNRTAWETATRSYLASHPEINVIMWSWCGQVDGSQAEIQNYLNLMSALEVDFPAVRFVYMTGHLNGGGATGNVTVRNNQIRDYCRTNNKTLFDFADIESYDPDGLVDYMALGCSDSCDYTSGGVSHNWATEWQAAHAQNVDWYDCGAAHSYPLNANRKAYAAWWLWARLGGWAGPVADSTPPTIPAALHSTSVASNRVELAWTAATDPESGVSGYRIYRGGVFQSYATGTTFADTTVASGTSYTYTVRAVNGASLVSGDSNPVTANTPVPTDTEVPTVPANLQASAVTTTTLHLGWNAATDNIGVTGYRIYRGNSLRATVTGTGFDDSGLTPATTYSYRVSALDAAGNESAQTDAVTARTFDPGQVLHTIRLQGSSQSVDSFLYESNPTTNYGNEPYVSTFDHFIIKFPLPAPVQGRRIVSAQAGFYVWAQTNYQAGQYMDLFRVTRDWSEGTVTWNNADAGIAWTTPGGDRAERVGRILQLSGAANWDHVFYPPVDLTLLVQKWAAGTVPNFGLVLVHSPVTGIGLKASEYSTAAATYLDITYSEEPAPALYELWMHGPFTDTQLGNPALEATVWGRNADPDGDGVINFFEYALGTNPSAAASGLAGALQCATASGGALELTFCRRTGTTGVGYTLERSFDLAAWTEIPATDRTEAVVADGGGLEDVVWQVQPLAGQPRAFYRLRLTAE